MDKIIKQAEKLCQKLRNSPKNDTYENYGQKEIRKFLDSVSDYHTRCKVQDVFTKYGF